VTLSDCTHLAHVIVLWQIQKLYVTVLFLLCFSLYLRATSKYKPLGAYIQGGDLTEGFLHYEFGGLIFGGAYFQNFTVFYLLSCFNLFILHPLITALQGVAINIFRIIITSPLYNNSELIT